MSLRSIGVSPGKARAISSTKRSRSPHRPPFAERLGDLEAIMEAEGARQASVFGPSEGGGLALRVASAITLRDLRQGCPRP